MTKKKFSRIYTDNTKYAEDKHNFFDALAFTVQKHLFTRKNAIYFLGGTFELWDFMTLTRYYIKASTSDFGQSEIESYISAMDEPYAQAFGGDAVEYTKDAKGIIVHATSANIMSMLWAAWIYARVASDIASDKNKRMWQRAAEQLYDSMEGFYDSSGQKCFGDNFGDNRLFSMSDEAMKTMVKYILAHDAKQAQHPQPEPAKEQQVSTGGDTSKLQARIKELEEENESLKKQLEGCQNQLQTIKKQGANNNEWIVELLAHLMYNNEQNAWAFLKEIQDLSDTEITDVVAEWVKDKKISSKSCRRDLWRILHAAKLYESTESNYNTAMKNKQ